MNEYYQYKDHQFKRGVTNRLNQVSKNKELDNEIALLKNANDSRLSRSETEVVTSYKQILNRPSSPHSVKLEAILNLGSYLFSDRGNQDEAIKVFEDYYTQFSHDPQYIKMYAIYNWAKGAKSYREKSIQILLEYFSRSENRKFSEDINIELFGTLLTNRAIFWIEQREETKTKYDRQEITSEERNKEWTEQKEAFLDISRHQGNDLFNLLKQKKSEGYEKLSSGARQNVAAALYQLVEIYIRLKQYHSGIEICDFAIVHLPKHFYDQFFTKRQLIYRFQER